MVRVQNPKNAHKKAQKSSRNFKLSIRNVISTEKNFAKKKMRLSMCLLAVLGSQGIVVKCTAAVVFHAVDSSGHCCGLKTNSKLSLCPYFQ